MAIRSLSSDPRVGMLAAIGSAAFFATSGPVAKSLLNTGWSAGAVVLLRVAGAAVLLLPFAIWTLRGRWASVRRSAGVVVAYGMVGIALPQAAFFSAIQTLDVGVALLLEYAGILLVVVWVSVHRRALPSRLTRLGMTVSLAGLVLVLNVLGKALPNPVGVGWGLLAALGLAGYYVIAARDDDDLPAIGLAGLGMTFGAVLLTALGVIGVLPMTFATADIRLGGQDLPWWLGIVELAVVAAALAYLLGVLAARRLGSTVASFVGLTEVLFAIVFAWLLLGELPRPVQLAGGILVLTGVVAVKLGERSSEPPSDHAPDDEDAGNFVTLQPIP